MVERAEVRKKRQDKRSQHESREVYGAEFCNRFLDFMIYMIPGIHLRGFAQYIWDGEK